MLALLAACTSPTPRSPPVAPTAGLAPTAPATVPPVAPSPTTPPATVPASTPPATAPPAPVAAAPLVVADPDVYDVEVGFPGLDLWYADATVATDGAVWIAAHPMPSDQDIDGFSYGIAFVRVDAAGTVDRSLGADGLVESGIVSSDFALASAPDGGFFFATAMFGGPATVERWDRSAVRDDRFPPATGVLTDLASAVVPAADGGGFVVGSVFQGGAEVVRLLADGTPDPAYAVATGGIATLPTLTSLPSGALLDDGTLRVGAGLVHALDADGTPDPAFGGGLALPGAIAFSPDGAMVGCSSSSEVTRYDAAGAPLGPPLALTDGPSCTIVSDRAGGAFVLTAGELVHVDAGGGLDPGFAALAVAEREHALFATDGRVVLVTDADPSGRQSGVLRVRSVGF